MPGPGRPGAGGAGRGGEGRVGDGMRGGAGREPSRGGESERECLLSAAGEDVVLRGLLTSGTRPSGGQPTCQKHTPSEVSFHLLLEGRERGTVGCFHLLSFPLTFN